MFQFTVSATESKDRDKAQLMEDYLNWDQHQNSVFIDYLQEAINKEISKALTEKANA